MYGTRHLHVLRRKKADPEGVVGEKVFEDYAFPANLLTQIRQRSRVVVWIIWFLKEQVHDKFSGTS